MNKIIAAAVIALAATTVTAGAASAFTPIKWYSPLNLKKAANSEVTSPGDAFQPFQKTADVRDTCAARGGELKKVFDGSDFVWTCVG